MLAQSLNWSGVKGTITQLVANCHVCQQRKYQATLTILKTIWERISMDFITKLPKLRGFDTILLVVDRLSRYAHFIALKHLFAARYIIGICIREVVKLHRILVSIASDPNSTFMSNFWQELFKL